MKHMKCWGGGGGGGGGAKLNLAVVLTYDTGRSDTILEESRGYQVKMQIVL